MRRLSQFGNKLQCFGFFTTKQHFHSTKIVRNRISKIRNLFPIVARLMKFGGLAHHNQQHEILKKIFYQRQFPLKESQ